MVKDAESHAGEDKKKRELIEARNQADGLVYTTEKSLSEHGDKVDAETKEKIQGALDNLKKAMEGDSAEEIQSKTQELAQVSHKLAEVMYSQAQEEGQAAEGEAQAGAEGAKDDNVVDAEFEDVDEDEKKK